MTGEKATRRRDLQGEEDRLRALGTVAAELLHDLATELAVVDGRIAVARQGVRQGILPRSELDALATDAERMRRMVRDVLDHLAGHSASPETAFDPEEGVRATIREWLPNAPSVEVTVSSTLRQRYRVHGRHSFFERALLNLVRNAARHARSQVSVAMDVEPGEGDRAELHLEVADDGSGLSRDVSAEELFQPFVAGQGDRTGLGLAVVRWCARALGGGVDHQGVGSLGGAAFTLRVPVREAPEPEASALAEGGGDPAAIEGLRLAVVDDDPALRRVYRRLLTRAGAEVRAIDPEEPDDLARELLAAEADAILLDVNLGVASGVEVWRAVRAVDPERADRIVLATAYHPDELGLPDEDGPPVVSKLAEPHELAARLRAAASP